VTVSNLELRLPVLERPGALGGTVRMPADKVVPPGYQLSQDYVPQGYSRPRGATPFRVSLAPAFQQCTAPNRQHGAPLAFGSCSPPRLTSDQLTVGTSDSNGQGAGFAGSVLYEVQVGDPGTEANEADVRVATSLSDIRKQGTLADYTGELSVEQIVQTTDRANGAPRDEPGTVQPSPFRFTVPCAATSDTTVGASCSLNSSLNAIVPGSVVEGERSIRELGEVDVFDGGADGQAGTAQDNTLFARQSLFVP
jgi:hypothetical protein